MLNRCSKIIDYIVAFLRCLLILEKYNLSLLTMLPVAEFYFLHSYDYILQFVKSSELKKI